jgi:hypothetical protein
VRRIILSKGTVVLVDDADYETQSRFQWYERITKGKCYAVRPVIINGKRRQVSMHREILGLVHGDGKKGDHRDGNALDNRRSNLRVATDSQNAMNMKPHAASGLKGAYRKGTGWMSRIMANGVDHVLGTFSTPEDAHAAYVRAAKRFHGEFARTQ